MHFFNHHEKGVLVGKHTQLTQEQRYQIYAFLKSRFYLQIKKLPLKFRFTNQLSVEKLKGVGVKRTIVLNRPHNISYCTYYLKLRYIYILLNRINIMGMETSEKTKLATTKKFVTEWFPPALRINIGTAEIGGTALSMKISRATGKGGVTR